MCACACLCVLGTACGSQLTIHLEASTDLNGVAPPFVKIDVTELGKPAKDFGPFNVDAVPNGNFVKVVPGQQFYLDVIGCKTGDVGKKSTCPDDQPDTFIARGCSTYFALDKDEPKDITIVVHNVSVGNGKCPPPAPPAPAAAK
mgnify:CR=1 FL=1